MATANTKLHERENVVPAAQQPARLIPLVLVVDDNEDMRFMLNTLLRMYGYDVVEAGDGAEAIRRIESERPDLVLMDGCLPHLDGLAATRRIRELPALGGVPIVLLSGRAEPSYRASALAAGCDDFLVKPLDFALLKNVLERHIGASVSGKREAAAAL
ncbi:MAG: response regulator [Pyrinomonadaceae bacterium]|jgi:CheY-like chemotaxis protein|nr:response regulator [Pyrinomonadaceae bacterium]